jgi:formyltetrahydrofolate deformylase
MKQIKPNKKEESPRATLLIHCADQTGLVAAVSDFLYKNQGNIIYLEQHVDAGSKRFFMRIEWELAEFLIPAEKIADYFQTLIAAKYDMQFRVFFSSDVPRMAIFVSKLSHCLFDILARTQSGEWNVDVPLIISNHPDLEFIAKQFGIDYHYLPVTKENKAEQEQKQIELLKQYKVDFIVLARYMQILSPKIIDEFKYRIINIHHSFLPAFPGAKPYHQAHERGVKIIGATSHYVTEDLDAGPIIEQDVAKISHKESVEDLVRKGKDLEKLVLSRAIRCHLERRVLVCNNRTIVFE